MMAVRIHVYSFMLRSILAGVGVGRLWDGRDILKIRIQL